jgi:endogenous inhibitor of DNA gyrase (YacG/DUF329 family)
MNITCPACKKKTAWKDNTFRPFCSERCKLIDLGKWAFEEYRIEGKHDDNVANIPNDKENNHA